MPGAHVWAPSSFVVGRQVPLATRCLNHPLGFAVEHVFVELMQNFVKLSGPCLGGVFIQRLGKALKKPPTRSLILHIQQNILRSSYIVLFVVRPGPLL